MSRAAAEVGSTANSYQILAKLASGGMADIFLARGEGVAGVERYCVLKRILRDRASDVHFVQMFLDEARLAAQLQHPNIAQVYDIGKLGDSYFFTMEYVHGETVRALLHRAQGLRRQLPIPCVLTIVAGAAAGLQHAHVRVGLDGRALGIVHRDVSPSNLMVSYEGGVKLVDFGVAKASDRATETKSGTVKGKISYLSPEQCRGKRVDRRSDLFSLGICFWEMLTTDRLYRRASDFENMNAIVSEPPPAPSERRPDVPPELDQLVVRLLAKDADERYQSADELVEAIEAVASQSGAMLSPTGLGKLVRELFGQRPEPWLELDAHQEQREPVTVTSEPIPPELAIPPADRIHHQLAGVVDLSAPRAVTESLDLADASSIKPARPPLPKLPGLPRPPPAATRPPGAPGVPPDGALSPAETLSLKPRGAAARPAGTRPPETLSLGAQDLARGGPVRPETLSLEAQDLARGGPVRPETLSLSAQDLVARPGSPPPRSTGQPEAAAVNPPDAAPSKLVGAPPSAAPSKPLDAAPGLRGRTPSTPPVGSPAASPSPSKPLDAAPGLRGRTPSTPPVGSPASAPSPSLSKPLDAAPGLRGRAPSTPPVGSPAASPSKPLDAAPLAPLDAPLVGEPTAPLGKPIKRGFPLAAPPLTQPGVAPAGAAAPGSPSSARSTGPVSAVRSTGPSPSVPVPTPRSTGPSPTVRSTGGSALAPPPSGDTFTEPDPTALPAPPLPPAGARMASGRISEVIAAAGSPRDLLAAPEVPGAAASSLAHGTVGAGTAVSTVGAGSSASLAAQPVSSSGPFAPASSSGPFAPTAPSGSFAPQPTLAPAQSASFAAQHAAPAVAHARAAAVHRGSSRRPGWPLYAVIVGAAILGSAAVIVVMRSGPEAAPIAASPIAASPVAAPHGAAPTPTPAPPEPERHAPIVEPIEIEGSAVPSPTAGSSAGATPPPARVPASLPADPGASPVAASTKVARPAPRGASAAVHTADKRDAAAHAADKRDAATDDIPRLYSNGQYDKVVAQCGFGPISAERTPLCFLAACHIGDEAAARRLLNVVPAARREQLTTNCKQFGVDVKKPDCEADPMACQH